MKNFSKPLNNYHKIVAGLLLTCCIISQVFAEAKENGTETILVDKAKLKSKLGLQILQVEQTPWPGMFVVMTDRGIFYTNKEVTLLVQGNLYDISDAPVNETDKFKASYLKTALPDMQHEWIEFTAPEEKQVLYIYTSPSCGFCRKLHNEIQEYLNAGVTIRYLAMPRAGSQSAEFKNMSNTWCKDNRLQKFNNMMSGATITTDSECSSSLQPHLSLAQNLSITSTPAVINESGQIQMGYRPWHETVAELLD